MSAMLQAAADLLQRFNDATTAFNNNDLDKYSKYFHNKIHVKHVHDHSKHENGVSSAKKYWRKKFAHKPQFTPYQPISVDAATGVVEGTALWEDTRQNNRISITIHYRFIFIHDPGKGWLIAHMYAHP
jgi:hypothetical protein